MKQGFTSTMIMIAMASAMAGSAFREPSILRPRYRDELEGIDIEQEYALIQEKRSRLTRRLRDMVVARHEYHLEQIKSEGGDV